MAERLYQVQTGETLKTIARDQLRDESRWQELAFINSLEQPYFVSPGKLILLPADGEAMQIVIKEYGEAPEKSSAATLGADFKLSPAELWLLAGGVAFAFWLWKR